MTSNTRTVLIVLALAGGGATLGGVGTALAHDCPDKTVKIDVPPCEVVVTVTPQPCVCEPVIVPTQECPADTEGEVIIVPAGDITNPYLDPGLDQDSMTNFDPIEHSSYFLGPSLGDDYYGATFAYRPPRGHLMLLASLGRDNSPLSVAGGTLQPHHPDGWHYGWDDSDSPEPWILEVDRDHWIATASVLFALD